MDYRIDGILQARILEWVAFPFSRGSSQPRDQTQGSNPGLLHCRWTLYQLSYQEITKNQGPTSSQKNKQQRSLLTAFVLD